MDGWMELYTVCACIKSYESRWMTLMRSAVTPMAVTAPPALCVCVLLVRRLSCKRTKATHPAPLTTNGFSPYLSV